MKKTILVCSLFIMASVSPVSALTIDVISSSNSTGINTWISGLGGQVNVLEDFENSQAGWYESLNTGVGTFTAGGLPGSGATSYNRNNAGVSNDPQFSIQNNTGSWYGRTNTTTGGRQWLDSGDITELTLDIAPSLSLTNLFFYLQDPSDVGATTTIGTDVSSNIYRTFSGESDGASYFVGITVGDNETLSQLSWSVSKVNDGIGVDDFSSVAPVPEPATMLLFGTGLAGLAGARFRRKKK